MRLLALGCAAEAVRRTQHSQRGQQRRARADPIQEMFPEAAQDKRGILKLAAPAPLLRSGAVAQVDSALRTSMSDHLTKST